MFRTASYHKGHIVMIMRIIIWISALSNSAILMCHITCKSASLFLFCIIPTGILFFIVVFLLLFFLNCFHCTSHCNIPSGLIKFYPILSYPILSYTIFPAIASTAIKKQQNTRPGVRANRIAQHRDTTSPPLKQPLLLLRHQVE